MQTYMYLFSMSGFPFFPTIFSFLVPHSVSLQNICIEKNGILKYSFSQSHIKYTRPVSHDSFLVGGVGVFVVHETLQ